MEIRYSQDKRECLLDCIRRARQKTCNKWTKAYLETMEAGVKNTIITTKTINVCGSKVKKIE